MAQEKKRREKSGLSGVFTVTRQDKGAKRQEKEKKGRKRVNRRIHRMKARRVEPARKVVQCETQGGEGPPGCRGCKDSAQRKTLKSNIGVVQDEVDVIEHKGSAHGREVDQKCRSQEKRENPGCRFP